MARKKAEIIPVRADRMRIIMADKKMNQEKFAKAVHSTQQTISRILNCKAPMTSDLVDEIHKTFPEYSAEWIKGETEYRNANEIIQHFVSGINGMVKANIDREEKMLVTFKQLVSSCGYAYSDGVIKKQIPNGDKLSPYDLKFYESLSVPVSHDEIDFLYSSFESIVKTFIEKKTNYIEK